VRLELGFPKPSRTSKNSKDIYILDKEGLE
jgi:hypothetical protein